MYILINTPESLTAFSNLVSTQTNFSTSKLKTAIAKAYKFKHITSLNASLTGEKPNTATTPKPIDVSFDVEKRACDLAEVNNPDDLSFSDCENAAEAVTENAAELINSKELGEALALLEHSGFKSLSNNIRSIYNSSCVYEHLKNKI